MIRGLLGGKRVLEAREQEIRARERELLDRLGNALARFEPDVADDDLSRFREAVDQLDGFFLLVVAGEFNSGKSTFINALLGEQALPEGVTPTTDRINVLLHGAEPGERAVGPFLVERTHPTDLLREIRIVDTPGTNAVIRRHEELTRDFIPRSDLVLFVTSADRPFTETERAFLEMIREWGKKVVMIVNKIDILDTAEDRAEVTRYVSENATRLLGEEPPLFPVSSRAARKANDESDVAAWRDSGFTEIESYLRDTLDEAERVKLKLLNPLGVGLRLAARYKDTAFERLKALAEDLEAIEEIDRRLARFHERMLADLEPRLAKVDALLHAMERRGDAFFEETIRIERIRHLFDGDVIQREFERDVIRDTPAEIEQALHEVIDWIVERSLEMWQDVSGAVNRRLGSGEQREMIGEIGRKFDYNRQALLESVGRLAQDVLADYDRETHGRAIANEVQGTFATTALAEVGAVGLGALVATAFAGALADVTGLFLGTMLAFGGFYLIPRKRRLAKREFRERIGDLRERLEASLTRQVHQEIEASTERLSDTIEPYRRWVTGQREALREARGELVAVEDALEGLKREIAAL